jgi:hypothetical protein
MKLDVAFRIIVADPLDGVIMKVQRGKNELLSSSSKDEKRLVFEFDITVDTTAPAPNFLGKYAQGPKDQRFVYVNSGSYAGHHGTCWNRRAKLSLMTITSELIDLAISDPANLVETTMPGIGRDGGPTCATVKGIEWRVVKK